MIFSIGGELWIMDYYKIGQRIRTLRKAKDISQEQLAEMISISTTHMSHIETGNTKLSLPVFVSIAEALDVQTDSLLHDEPQNDNSKATNDISSIIASCTAKQAAVIVDVVKALKHSIIYL